MRIDVWSDILCPFCHVGRRHLELALTQFEHADEVDVVWHSFMLDRAAPAEDPRSMPEILSAKYGVSEEQAVAQQERMAADAAAVGLDFQWERIVAGSSYDAHRLIHLARSLGLEARVTERVMRAWYSEGASIGDHETLVRLAVEAGLDEATVRALLESDEHGIDVRTDVALATQLGIGAVPTFVLDRRYAVSGAQPVDVLLDALRQAWELQGSEPEPSEQAGGCCGGACECGSAGEPAAEAGAGSGALR